MEGWIKIHRKLLDWEWYTDSNTKDLFIHLLLTANYEDKKWQGITIEKGSLVTSRQHLAEELKMSEQNVRTSLLKLQKTRRINHQINQQIYSYNH